MKLTIARTPLLAALTPAVAVTSRKSPSAFGSCVLLTAARGALTITARDMSASVRATVDAEIAKPGTTMVYAEDLLDRISAMPDGQIDVSLSKDKFTLASGTRVYTMRKHPDESGFPAFPAVPAGAVALPAKALLNALSQVVYAQADGYGAPAFCGVALAANDTGITAYASDTKRIARAVVGLTDGAAIDTFIPTVATKVITGALESSGDVEIASSDTSVYIKIGAVELSYQRPGVASPPYANVMKFLTANDGPRVSRRDMLARVRGVTVGGTSGNVPVALECKGGAIALSHTSLDGDVSTDAMPAEGTFAWSVMVEARYLLDALGRLSGDQVRICAVDDLQQPMVLRDDAGGLATIARIGKKEAA